MATWHSSVPDAAHPNLNAPLVAALFVPLKALATVRSYMLRSLCSVFAPLVAGWMLWRTRDPQQRNHRERVWSWIPLLACCPTHTAPMLGQVTFVTMVPVVDAWAAACRGRDGLAGALLGLATHFRLFVALLAVFFNIRRRWRRVRDGRVGSGHWNVDAAACRNAIECRVRRRVAMRDLVRRFVERVLPVFLHADLRRI